MSEPVEIGERLPALDILRGLALFGMILVHFHQKTRIEVGGIEDLIGWGVYVLVEQKAWATFAFLFGAGFAILLRRLEARGQPVVPTYLRRMAMLALFGVVADVGFGFHILFQYACWGLVLLVVRRWSDRALLLTAAAAVCARPVVAELTAIQAWTASAAPGGAAVSPLSAAVEAAASHGSYRTLLAARWALWTGSFPHAWRDLLPDVNLTLFVLGLLAIRRGIFEQPLRHRRTIVRWMAFGLCAWAASWLVLPNLPKTSIPGAQWPIEYGFGLVQDQWLCFTYIGAVVLLLAYRPAWTARLAFLGFAGRMALTNYLVQAALLDALSSGYGAHLKLRPSVYLVCAVALFALVALASRAWLARFRFGPVEWLWRVVTYLQFYPLRHTPSAGVPAHAGVP